MTERQEHLNFCKQRALAYVDTGDLNGAFASFASDLGKYDDLKGAYQLMAKLGMPLLMNNHLDTPEKMREWIKGFN